MNDIEFLYIGWCKQVKKGVTSDKVWTAFKVGDKYYANNCPKCGVISGDFYLHSEPGAPFFPTDPNDAELLTIETIPIDHACFVLSGCGYGTGELILRYAKRTGPTLTPNDDNT